MNFDVIAINIQGDREIAFNEEVSVTNKQLAEILKESLRYVAGGHYQQTDYHSYSRQRTEELLEVGVTIDLGRVRQ